MVRHREHCKMLILERAKFDGAARANDVVAELLTRVEKLEQELAQMKQKPVAIPRIIITNEENGTINECFAPNLNHITEEMFYALISTELMNTPVAMVSLIWCNRTFPENFSVSVINEAAHKINVFDGNKWIHCNYNEEFARKLHTFTYALVIDLYDKFNPVFPTHANVREQLSINRSILKLIKADCKLMYQRLLENKVFFVAGKPGTTHLTLL
jgi:hypothetical protein